MLGERMFAYGRDLDEAKTLMRSAHAQCGANPRLDPPMCKAIASWIADNG